MLIEHQSKNLRKKKQFQYIYFLIILNKFLPFDEM